MPNSIDPAVFFDDDGSQHLVYGGGRIWMTELDPVTGRQIEDNWWSKSDPTYHFQGAQESRRPRRNSLD